MVEFSQSCPERVIVTFVNCSNNFVCSTIYFCLFNLLVDFLQNGIYGGATL